MARTTLTRKGGNSPEVAGMEYKSRHGHASIERLYKGEREEIDLHETRTVATVSVRDVMLTTLRILHAHKRCVCRLRGGNPFSGMKLKVPNGVVCLKCVN